MTLEGTPNIVSPSASSRREIAFASLPFLAYALDIVEVAIENALPGPWNAARLPLRKGSHRARRGVVQVQAHRARPLGRHAGPLKRRLQRFRQEGRRVPFAKGTAPSADGEEPEAKIKRDVDVEVALEREQQLVHRLQRVSDGGARPGIAANPASRMSAGPSPVVWRASPLRFPRR